MHSWRQEKMVCNNTSSMECHNSTSHWWLCSFTTCFPRNWNVQFLNEVYRRSETKSFVMARSSIFPIVLPKCQETSSSKSTPCETLYYEESHSLCEILQQNAEVPQEDSNVSDVQLAPESKVKMKYVRQDDFAWLPGEFGHKTLYDHSLLDLVDELEMEETSKKHQDATHKVLLFSWAPLE